MNKSLSKLSQIYLNKKDGQEFFNYIVGTQISGRAGQVVRLFKKLRHADKARFLIELTKIEGCCELPFSYIDRRECFTNIVNNIFKTK